MVTLPGVPRARVEALRDAMREHAGSADYRTDPRSVSRRWADRLDALLADAPANAPRRDCYPAGEDPPNRALLDAPTFEAEGRRAAARSLPRATSYPGADGAAWLRGWDSHAREHAALRSASSAPAPDPGALTDVQRIVGLWAIGLPDDVASRLRPPDVRRLADALAGAPTDPGALAACVEEERAALDAADDEERKAARAWEKAARATSEEERVRLCAAASQQEDLSIKARQRFTAARVTTDAALARARAPGRVVASIEGKVGYACPMAPLSGIRCDDGEAIDIDTEANPDLAALPVGARVRVLVVEETAGEKGTP